jgi:DNA polymerase III epsilon subunit-like protein
MSLTSKYLFIGLDIESSGTNLNQGARVIQVGYAYNEDGAYWTGESGVNPLEFAWSAEAQAVHNITLEEVNTFPEATEVDKKFSSEFIDFRNQEVTLIAVGFNVGSFDLPFIRESLPIFSKNFSHRVVDLNSLIFALAKSSGSSSNFESIKSELKNKAEKIIATILPDKHAHSAGYDALEAIIIFELITSKSFEDIGNITSNP